MSKDLKDMSDFELAVRLAQGIATMEEEDEARRRAAQLAATLDEAFIPTRIVLEDESFGQVVEMLESPPKPTGALRNLFLVAQDKKCPKT